MFEENLKIFEKCPNRENIEYYYYFENFIHRENNSSSLYFVFQIGKDIIDEQFKEDANRLIEIKKQEVIKSDGGNEENKIYSIHQSNYSEAVSQTTFDISFSINLINSKMITFHVKNFDYGKLIFREIQIPTYFYLNTEDVTIITETFVKKNYNTEVAFNGIINEAMTCYMNSMLQTLNIMGYFKKAIYRIESENTDDIAYCLQRFFYDLSTEKIPISTNKLVKSFGWSREDIFVQHDVQEFNMLLADIMEKKMKGTESENTFKYLFEGMQLSYIKCLDIDYESKREECYSDVQLTVKGCKGLIDSFQNYIQREVLEGEDMFEVEGRGKQRAEIGKIFLNFPNVMIIQLKRFEYNAKKDVMDKVNDCFEYEDEMDMRQFIDKPDEDQDYRYTLHSVVIHKGNMSSGHYFAYIRPSMELIWYYFNDEIVREADIYEVFNANFGGLQKIYKHKHLELITEHMVKNDSSAYILVYIRNSEREKIISKISENDVNYLI
jgi:ubiquitin carboxyl-terminal hydrolase 7